MPTATVTGFYGNNVRSEVKSYTTRKATVGATTKPANRNRPLAYPKDLSGNGGPAYAI